MAELMYKFDRNLLKLSENQDLELAKQEWREVYKEKRPQQDGLCICQHNIKHIVYMFNIKTNYTICVGTKCCKKFNLKRKKINNSILEDVIQFSLIKGNYQIITDVLEYSNNIKSQLLQYIRNKYENIPLYQLRILKNDIYDLIHNYNLKYLQEIYIEINDKIIYEETQLIEKNRIEQLEIQRRHNEYIEGEKKRKELQIQLQMQEEFERNERYCIMNDTYKKSLELKKKTICCRCNIILNETYTKYDKDVTKTTELYACIECNKLINHWLINGHGEKSFEI